MQAGLRIEHAVGVERLEHAFEPRLEGVHAHQRHHARDQPRRIAVDVIDIGQRLGEFGRRLADHRHRNVAEAGVLRQHGEEGFHHARRKAVAHHDAVDVARVEMLGGGLHAERAQHLDALAHRHAELGIERPAAGDQHGGVVERIADRQRRQPAVMRGEGLDAAQHGRMQGAHAHGRLQARDQPLDRQRGVGRQARSGWRLPGRRSARAITGTMMPLAVAICRQSMRAADSLGGGARLGDHHGGRLDRDEGGRRVGPVGLDDREGAGGAQRIDQVGRRTVGDHDHRTLQRHGAHARGYKRWRNPSGARLIPRQRNRKIKRHLPRRGRNAPAISGLTPRACNSAATAPDRGRCRPAAGRAGHRAKRR